MFCGFPCLRVQAVHAPRASDEADDPAVSGDALTPEQTLALVGPKDYMIRLVTRCRHACVVSQSPGMCPLMDTNARTLLASVGYHARHRPRQPSPVEFKAKHAKAIEVSTPQYRYAGGLSARVSPRNVARRTESIDGASSTRSPTPLQPRSAMLSGSSIPEVDGALQLHNPMSVLHRSVSIRFLNSLRCWCCNSYV